MVYDITMSPNAIDSRYCMVWFICSHISASLFQMYELFLSLSLFPTMYTCYNRMIIDLLSKLVEQTEKKFPLCEIFGVCMHAY